MIKFTDDELKTIKEAVDLYAHFQGQDVIFKSRFEFTGEDLKTIKKAIDDDPETIRKAIHDYLGEMVDSGAIDAHTNLWNEIGPHYEDILKKLKG